MNIESVSNDKTLFVIGAPRSGTTWVGKIIDSNPMVLYRHEPDTVLRNPAVQGIFCAEDYEQHLDEAAKYLRQLVSARVLKSSGTLPVFRKDFRSASQHFSRLSLIVALRVTEKLTRDSHALRRTLVPDMVDPAVADKVFVAVKSNISRGRIGLFAAARPGSRFLFLIRDPFGQIASMMRGIQLGKFERVIPVDDCLSTPQAQRYGLTSALFERLAPVEQHAWNWALMNEKALDDLKTIPGYAKVMRYRDIVDDPIGSAKDIFKFAGLEWNEQTATFLQSSMTARLPDSYYQIYKNSLESLNKWRRQLTTDQQRQIVSTLRGTVAWGLYPELHSVSE